MDVRWKECILLDCDGLNTLLKKISERYKIFYHAEDGTYKEFEGKISPHTINFMLSSPRPSMSIKRYLHPPIADLFEFCYHNNNVEIFRVEYEKPQLILGVRGCDIRALQVLDKYFMHDVCDPVYTALRKNTLFISVPCTKKGDYCFCSKDIAMEFVNAHAFIVPHDNGYILCARDEKIIGLLSGLGKRLPSADIERIMKKIEAEVDDYTEDIIPNAYNWVRERNIAEVRERIEELASLIGIEHCISCGMCNFLCPTCHCYDVRDEWKSVEMKEGKRLRVWDSCHLYEFALVAGGHNFRGPRSHRAYYRIMDKISLSTARYGMMACVGCGRCIEYCPVGVDIREVFRRLGND